MIKNLRVRARTNEGTIVHGYYCCKFDEEKNEHIPCVLVSKHSSTFELTVLKEYAVDENTVERSTGLTEKQGKEVYENDLFTLSNDGIKGQIVWNDEVGAFQMKFLTDFERDNIFLGNWIKGYRKD